MTVVREQACPAGEYFERPKKCDLPLPKEGSLAFSSEAATQSIVQKLVIRRDDRDNAALGANPTSIDSVSIIDNRHVQLVGATSIPTGAVKKDAIGRTVQETLTRLAKAQVGVQPVEGKDAPSLLSV